MAATGARWLNLMHCTLKPAINKVSLTVLNMGSRFLIPVHKESIKYKGASSRLSPSHTTSYATRVLAALWRAFVRMSDAKWSATKRLLPNYCHSALNHSPRVNEPSGGTRRDIAPKIIGDQQPAPELLPFQSSVQRLRRSYQNH